MPNAQRLIISLEPALRRSIMAMAARDGMSVSGKARDLLLHAVEVDEDAALEAAVAPRMRDRAAKSVGHEEFWRTARKREKSRKK